MAARWRFLAPLLAGALTTVALAVGGAYWWRQKQTFTTTDNAFVQADKVAISPLVDGYVTEVLVTDNQAVQAGQLLVRIDPASLRARLAQAQAETRALEAAVQGVDDKAALEQSMIVQKAGGVDAARARADMAAAEQAR